MTGAALALLSVVAPAMQRGDDALSKTALVREDIVVPPAPALTPEEQLKTYQGLDIGRTFVHPDWRNRRKMNYGAARPRTA